MLYSYSYRGYLYEKISENYGLDLESFEVEKFVKH